MANPNQWIRKISLVVAQGTTPSNAFNGLDLSQARIKFTVHQIDNEVPNYAEIRVYNLDPGTQAYIMQNLNTVFLGAGYQTGLFGNIFTGQIKQFRKGKEDAVTTYLDILAGDGDLVYNWAQTSLSVPKNTTYAQVLASVAKQAGIQLSVEKQTQVSFGGTLVRGKVMFGMARDIVRDVTTRAQATWSIINGVMKVCRYDTFQQYAPIELSASTGVVGVPEQTDEGVKVKCLLNPNIIVQGTAIIDNSLINTTQFGNTGAAGSGYDAFTGVPYNQRVGLVQLPNVAQNNGIYKIYCVEHEGDTRGQEWYSTLTLLSTDPMVHTVKGSPAT